MKYLILLSFILINTSLLAEKLNVKAKLFNFNSNYEDAKINRALEAVKIIVNTPKFKDGILNHEFKGEKTFNDNNGLTNQEIYDLILTGKEKLIPVENQTLDYELKLYRSVPWSSVLGYTNPDEMMIYINKKFFYRSSYNCLDVAANLIHEWLHKVGFGHSYKYNDDRPYSVPYAVGYMAHEIGYQMGLEEILDCTPSRTTKKNLFH